jgi:peptidoglycan/xylan/chitin deacetylase (PgdA/CDA1 family)
MKLSVVIATRNRSGLLLRCLEALSRQTEDPANFEVIVADDGSDDGTGEALERLQAPFELRVLPLGGNGQASAQNAAIEVARGEVCLFLDDDVVARPELIAEHLAAHRLHERMIGVGRLSQQAPEARDWYAHEFAASWNRHYDELGEQPLDWISCFGGNLSARRADLDAVGGFATDLRAGDDIELSFRLQQSGCTPRYLPLAAAVHDDQKRCKQMLADCKRQGASGVELAERHPQMMPKLLGWFAATTPREQVLRRLLITMRASPRLLAALGRLMPGTGRRQIWFQFVSRFAFWRAVRAKMSRERWVRTTHGVPVLMYHAFSERDESDRYVVCKRVLKRQMRILSLLRFRAIGFEELAQTLRDGRLPPARAFSITIDDGYRDNLEIAQPILEKHGFAATIFLVGDRIGGVCDWTEEEALHGRPLLSAEEISGLLGSTTTFGAHTRTHCSLPDLPDDDVTGEIAGSRDDLEAQLGAQLRTFAYPYGRFDERAVAAVGEAGFTGAGTVVPRRAQIDDDPLQIPRIEVRAEDSLPRFVFKLWFGGT